MISIWNDRLRQYFIQIYEISIVGLITPYRTYLTITKTRKGRPRPDPGCSATDDDDDTKFYWTYRKKNEEIK
jgi:hypothetical protein